MSDSRPSDHGRLLWWAASEGSGDRGFLEAVAASHDLKVRSCDATELTSLDADHIYQGQCSVVQGKAAVARR